MIKRPRDLESNVSLRRRTVCIISNRRFRRLRTLLQARFTAYSRIVGIYTECMVRRLVASEK
jgi:hypothetical protein